MPAVRNLFTPALLAISVTSALAQSYGGKLLATGGVTQVEGSAGGGLTPWAVIGGYGVAGQYGGNVFYTAVKSRDYRLDAVGAMAGIHDRLEVSFAEQRFDTRQVGAALGLGAGFTFRQQVFGAKVRLFGDAVYDQDRWWPQVSAGVQSKRNNQGTIVRAVGAKSDRGTDLYLSATKLYLDQSLLLNGTLRATKANQIGILGFGGDGRDGYRIMAEGSAALLLTKNWVVGAEYRQKPDNLRIAREQDWWDVFVAWVPNKRVSVTLAYAHLGDIVTFRNQRGPYVSLQAGF